MRLCIGALKTDKRILKGYDFGIFMVLRTRRKNVLSIGEE
jgi:hypothetical protein